MREFWDNIFLILVGCMILIIASNFWQINKSFDNIEKELKKNEQLIEQYKNLIGVKNND